MGRGALLVIFSGAEAMLTDLKVSVFPTRPVRFRSIVDGRAEVREVRW